MTSLLEQMNIHERTGSIKDLVFPVSNTYNFLGKDKVVFINTGDVYEGKFLHSNVSEVKKLPGQAKKIIERGDILFSEIRPKNRHFALVDFDTKDYVVSTKLIVLKVKEGVDPHFAYVVLTAQKNLSEFQNIAESRSGTFPQITFDSIADFEVKLPSLKDQKKIAEIIGSYNKKIDNNDLIIKNLESVAKAIFDEWFINYRFPNHKKVGFVDSEMGEIPEGWSIGNITNLVQRLSVQKMYREEDLSETGSIPVYDQSSKGIIGYHNDAATFNATPSHPVLIFGDHTCRTQLVCEPFSLGPNTIPLSGVTNHGSIFTYFAIKGLIEQREYKRHWNELLSINILIPTKNLIDTYSEKVNFMIEKMNLCDKENILLKSCRDRLLAKLI